MEPVTVRLNRTLVAADIVTVQPTPGTNLEGIAVAAHWADDMARGRGGGGDGHSQLDPHESIDVFVTTTRSRLYGRLGSSNTYSYHLPRGDTLLLQVSWSTVNGLAQAGLVVIVWSHARRAARKRPYLVSGERAQTLLEYATRDTVPFSAQLLGGAPRVKYATRREVRQRQLTEAERNLTTNADGESPLGPVKSISVAGFRGYNEEQALNLAIPSGEPGSGLTIVVGANNAGKSTIWESFDAVARKLRHDVSFSEGRRNRARPDGIEIAVTWVDGSRYVVSSQNANTSETRAEWFGRTGILERPEIVSVPSRRGFQARFGSGTTTERDWMASNSDFSRTRQRDNNDQFTGRLFELHNNPEKKRRFDTSMTEVLGEPMNWSIDLSDGHEGQSYYLKVTSTDGVNHTSEGLGDGIISLLFILNALYDSEPTTLLVLDEPELSLHPQLLRRLGRVLADYARDRQIVILTHSPALVAWDYIAAGAEIARVYKQDGASRIAQAGRRTVDDLSKARGGWTNPHVLGSDANEALFLDDGVVVVEGQEDAALLPRAALLVDMNVGGAIFGWGSGGESNIGRILRLLADLGFVRVAAVLDNNVPGRVATLAADFPEYLVTTIPAADIRDKPGRQSTPVAGLMDERGKTVKPEHRDAFKTTLRQVNRYLAPAAEEQR